MTNDVEFLRFHGLDHLDRAAFERDLTDNQLLVTQRDLPEGVAGEPATIIATVVICSAAITALALTLGAPMRRQVVERKMEVILKDGTTVRVELKISSFEREKVEAELIRALKDVGVNTSALPADALEGALDSIKKKSLPE